MSFKNSRCSPERHSKSWRLVAAQFFLYDIDFVYGRLIDELARRSIQKNDKTVKLLRHNNHIYYVKNINALFKAFQCNTRDTFFSKTGNLERQLVTCGEPGKNI